MRIHTHSIESTVKRLHYCMAESDCIYQRGIQAGQAGIKVGGVGGSLSLPCAFPTPSRSRPHSFDHFLHEPPDDESAASRYSYTVRRVFDGDFTKDVIFTVDGSPFENENA